MKREFTWAGIVTTLLLGISTFFIACNEDIPEFVRYNGKVVYVGTTNPFSALEVKITNGNKIHCNGYTDEEGQFSLSVKISEIDGSYYLLIGDETCIPQKIQLSGFGQGEVNIGTIEIEGPTLPTVTTSPISNISDNKATSGGKVTFGGRLKISARGICWAKTKNPTIYENHTNDGTGEGEFTSQLTELDGGELYYVRAYATNQMGTAYGEELTFTTITGLPTVTTGAVSNITATTATCGGNVAAGSGYSITARGVCWSSTTATPTINDPHTSEIGSTGSFTSTMIGLERNTTYYVRAYATNQKGTSYGETKEFTTLNGLPTVITSAVTEIKATSAMAGGNVTNNGGFAIKARGICWSSTSSSPSITSNHTNEIADNGSFTSLMTGLTPSTTYYMRAYATNEVGTNYGEVRTFTTADGKPVVATTSVTLSGDVLISGGNVTDDGGFPITARGVCYGNFQNPDLSSTYSHTSNGTGTGYFTSNLGSSLTGIIYVRAYATNANGTTYGNQISVDVSFLLLPSFTYNGKTYMIAPDPHTKNSECISWSEANSYCENLTAYGYSDWRMPTADELLAMNKLRSSIGGWKASYTSTSNTPCYSVYWSSTIYYDFHKAMLWDIGSYIWSENLETTGKWLITDDTPHVFYIAHVRPIREYK